MNEYELGKDIQQILERLSRLEATLGGATKQGCGCGQGALSIQDEDEVEVFFEGDRPVEVDGKMTVLASKSFVWPASRMCNDYCNWRRQETVTIWSNGRYEDVTEIKCEHGYLFGCVFEVTMRYKDNAGAEITTTHWRRGLGGTQSAEIRNVGYNRAIELSYNRITRMTRSRHAEC